MKKRVLIQAACLLAVLGMGGCLSYYRYYARLRIHSDVYNSWDATDTVWLRFVGHKQVPAYLGTPRAYYHSDSSSLIIYNYNAEYGIDTMSCSEYRRLVYRISSDGNTTPPTIQKYEVEYGYILSSADFQNVLACDTILLYINEEQLACWTPENIPETYKNIFDYQTAWFYSDSGKDASFILDKSDIRKLREMKAQH